MKRFWIGVALFAGLAVSGGRAMAQGSVPAYASSKDLSPNFPDLGQLFAGPKVGTPEVLTGQRSTPRAARPEGGAAAGNDPLLPGQKKSLGMGCPSCMPGGELFPGGSGGTRSGPQFPYVAPRDLFPRSLTDPEPPKRMYVIEQVSNASIGLYNGVGLEVEVRIEGGQNPPVSLRLVGGQMLSVALTGSASMTVRLAPSLSVNGKSDTGPVSAGKFYYIRPEGSNVKLSQL